MKASDKPDIGPLAPPRKPLKPPARTGELPPEGGAPPEKSGNISALAKVQQDAKAQIRIPPRNTGKLPDLKALLGRSGSSPSLTGNLEIVYIQPTKSASVVLEGASNGIARASLQERARDLFGNSPQIAEAIDRLTSTGNARRDQQALADLVVLLERDPALFKQIMAETNAALNAPPMVDNPLSRPERRVELFQQLIGQMARPESISQGQGTVTCAASVAQVMLLHIDPRAYFDMVRDLITVGSHTTRGGHVLDFPRDMPREHGRTQLDAVIQSVLYNEAQKFPPAGQPVAGTGDQTAAGGNPSRPAGSRPSGGRGSPGSGGAQYGGEAVEGGLHTGQIDRLLENLTGTSWTWEDITDADDGYRAKVWDALKAHMTGERPRSDHPYADFDLDRPLSEADGSAATRGWGVPAGIYTASGIHHEVLIQGFEKGHVIYYDPATGRQERVPEAMFFESLCHVMLPESGLPEKGFTDPRDRQGEGAAIDALGRLLGGGG